MTMVNYEAVRQLGTPFDEGDDSAHDSGFGLEEVERRRRSGSSRRNGNSSAFSR